MRIWSYILFVFVYLLILLLGRYYSSEVIFIVKSLFLTFYLILEILSARIQDPKNWMLNPVVLASILTFIIGYGVTNLIYYIPNSAPQENLLFILGSDSFNLLNATIDYVIFGAASMWVGYKSNLGIFLFRFMTTSVVNLRRFFKISFKINITLIYTFIFISILVRLYAIFIGVYGYSQTPEQISESAGISQYLYLIGLLAQYSLLVISLIYYSSEEKKSLRATFISLILVEIFFGLISGMKSLVVIPLVIPFIAFLVLKQRVKKSLVVMSVVAIVVAYIIIEPFRILRFMDPNFKSTPSYIIQTLYNAYILNEQVGLGEAKDVEFFLFALLSRNNYMIEASLAIDYDKKIGLNEYDPDFLSRLYYAPLHAVVPRFLWAGKPFENTGHWFTRRVLGYDFESSTGFTPFGFLYFAGGVPFIVLFFFIFGIMQNALFRFLGLGSGGVIIYLGLLTSVILIDHLINGVFISWIRYYPMLLILQYFTFKN